MGRHRDPWVIAIFALAGTCAYLYLVASTAGLLLGAGWPRVPPASLPLALVSWVSHPGDPTHGFPKPVQARLPGALGFYATLAMLSAALGYVAFAVSRGHGFLGARASRALSFLRGALGSTGYDPAMGARWGSARDLRALIVSGSQAGRLTLGRIGSHLLAAEHGHSLLVVGPTRTFKTTGLAIPALLEWQGPALCTSIRRDLLDATRSARSRMGQVWVYDPAGSSGVQSCHWNPLEHCQTWAGSWRIAGSLVGAARSMPGQSAEARFWQRAAEKLLAPLLFAAARNGLSMFEVIHWINTREREEVECCLNSAGSELANDAFKAATLRDERTLASIYTTLETTLCAYEDTEVLASTMGNGISGERLLEDPGASAYICAPPHEQERLAPLFTALVREVIAAAYDRQARTGKALDPPLLILLDEAGNIAPIPDLGKLAATAAGVGVQIVSVWHDLAQLHAFYESHAETVLNNHRAKLVLPGVGDERTLKWVQSALGERAVKQRSHTHGEKSSRTESSTFRALAPADLTRQQQRGEALLIYGHLPAARIRLRPYYAEPALRALAQGEPAGPDRPAFRARLARAVWQREA